MEKLLDIIIPTWNNPSFLNPCVQSILSTGILQDLGRLIIVNNGEQDIKRMLANTPNVDVISAGKNLGWERGLEFGLQQSSAPFVVFQNDDTHIPPSSRDFYLKLLHPFRDANVAAVGPSTTVAAGWHSIYRERPLSFPHYVSYLIFFTVAVRRAALDEVGGIDVTCPGGDDIDLSMRFRAAGKHTVINPAAFLIHHGFKSGTRLRGDHTVKGGWNSQEMQDETNRWLIQKHGFKNFVQTMQCQPAPLSMPAPIDAEGNTVREFVQGEAIVELGCGFRKTVPNAVGVDRVTAGEHVPHVGDGCVADVQADVTEALPFADKSQDCVIARHILEHCVDTVATLRHWTRILKVGGRLIIAVPNEELGQTIPMNPEHVHAFTPKSLGALLEVMGFRHIETADPQNGVSFVACFEKVLSVVEKEVPALA